MLDRIDYPDRACRTFVPIPYRPYPRAPTLSTSPLCTLQTGHALRPYQLEGLNWLLFSWYTRRSVM